MLETTNARSGPYICDGTIREFDFDFPVIDPSHVAVYKDGERLESSAYGLETWPGGGRISLNAIPANGSRVAIVRDVPLLQDVDLQNNTAFLPEVIEAALDRLTMICQQLRETFSRTLTVPPTEDMDQNQLYNQFADLIGTAQTWSDQAAEHADAAAEAATSAQQSRSAALVHVTGAYQYFLNCIEYDRSARSASYNAGLQATAAGQSASSAGAAADSIESLANNATLERVSLFFGDWGLDGIFISYDDWTAASTIMGIANQLAAHDTDPEAHGSLAGTLAGVVATHDTSGTAHQDIRNSISPHINSAMVSHNTSGTAHPDLRGLLSGTLLKNFWASSQVTPVAGKLTVAHGLSLDGDALSRALVDVRLVCASAEAGYSIGEYAPIILTNYYASVYGLPFQHYSFLPVTPVLTATEVHATLATVFYSNVTPLYTLRSDTGAPAALTLSKWRYVFRIWY